MALEYDTEALPVNKGIFPSVQSTLTLSLALTNRSLWKWWHANSQPGMSEDLAHDY